MAPQVRPAETDSFEAEGGSYHYKTTWYSSYLKYNYSIAGFEPRLNEKNYFISRRTRQRFFCKSNLIESEDKKTELFAYSTHSYKPIEPLSQPQIISASSSHDLSIHWGLLQIDDDDTWGNLFKRINQNILVIIISCCLITKSGALKRPRGCFLRHVSTSYYWEI